MDKKNLLSNGLEIEKTMALYSYTQTAKGMLATLELGHQSSWMQKYNQVPPTHLLILLQAVMEEIVCVEKILSTILDG